MRFDGNAPQVFGGKRIDRISLIETGLLRQFRNAIAPFSGEYGNGHEKTILFAEKILYHLFDSDTAVI
jgi:hypothetical protein